MDRDAVECMSRVAAILARCKDFASDHVRPVDPDSYVTIREMLYKCQEILAIQCDTAPIRLISGQVDYIMENLKFSEKTPSQGA